MKTIIPNCSEAVFKFFTTDVKRIQTILQAIKDEIDSHYSKSELDRWQKRGQIPLLKDHRMYDTGWNGELEYHGSEADEMNRQRVIINKRVEDGELDEATAQSMLLELEMRKTKKIYPNSMIKACAGLGDNDSIITAEDDGIVLNVGNNDISDNDTGWIDVVKDMGIPVAEAEHSAKLREMARDCTCGITYFDGYDKLITDEKTGEEDEAV